MQSKVKSKSSSQKVNRPIAVGDRVFWRSGDSIMPLRVIEDRGHIGLGGRRILGVEALVKDLAEVSRFEIAEAAVLRRRPRQPKSRPATLRKPAKARRPAR
jgi:hypothetical protein